MTLDEARKTGSIRYFTGKPCKHGHIAERATTNSTCIECRSIRATEWVKANRDRHNETNRLWEAKNPEKVKRIGKIKYEKNKPAYFAKSHLRRARKKLAEGFFTQKDIELLRLNQPSCQRCASSYKLEIDHIIPLNRGGTNWPDNLQILCRSCNRSKGTKLESEWVSIRGNI